MADHEILYVDGPVGRIAYRRKGTGPALLLLHPLALSGAVWDRLSSDLAGDFDVICPDARGHGASGWDKAGFGVNDMAADLVTLLDALDLKVAHALGMSMGGSVAIAHAGLHPDRVDRLVLADTTAWYGESAPQTWEQRAQRALAVSRRRQIPFQTDRWFTQKFRHHDPDEVRRVVNIFLATDSAAHAAASIALGEMDSRPLLSKTTAPTLVFTGEEDYATPVPMGEFIAQAVPDGSFIMLPGLRHLSLVERPELARLVHGHLTGAPLPDLMPIADCGCAGASNSPQEGIR